MQAILDFSQELDVSTLDRVVQVMYTTAGAEVGSQEALQYPWELKAAIDASAVLSSLSLATRGPAYLDAVPGTPRGVAARTCDP